MCRQIVQRSCGHVDYNHVKCLTYRSSFLAVLFIKSNCKSTSNYKIFRSRKRCKACESQLMTQFEREHRPKHPRRVIPDVVPPRQAPVRPPRPESLHLSDIDSPNAGTFENPMIHSAPANRTEPPPISKHAFTYADFVRGPYDNDIPVQDLERAFRELKASSGETEAEFYKNNALSEAETAETEVTAWPTIEPLNIRKAPKPTKAPAPVPRPVPSNVTSQSRDEQAPSEVTVWPTIEPLNIRKKTAPPTNVPARRPVPSNTTGTRRDEPAPSGVTAWPTNEPPNVVKKAKNGSQPTKVPVPVPQQAPSYPVAPSSVYSQDIPDGSKRTMNAHAFNSIQPPQVNGHKKARHPQAPTQYVPFGQEENVDALGIIHNPAANGHQKLRHQPPPAAYVPFGQEEHGHPSRSKRSDKQKDSHGRDRPSDRHDKRRDEELLTDRRYERPKDHRKGPSPSHDTPFSSSSSRRPDKSYPPQASSSRSHERQGHHSSSRTKERSAKPREGSGSSTSQRPSSDRHGSSSSSRSSAKKSSSISSLESVADSVSKMASNFVKRISLTKKKSEESFVCVEAHRREDSGGR